MAQPALGEWSCVEPLKGPVEFEFGLGVVTWVYENARLLVDGDLWGFAIGFAGVDGKSVVIDLIGEIGIGLVDGGLMDSESDALSQASSSAQSIAAYDDRRVDVDGFNPM